MKIFLNIISLLVFFTVYHNYNIYIATNILMLISTISFFINYMFYKKIDITDIVNISFILIFGYLTIHLHNAMFIKWKITILYFIISIIFYYYHLKKKTLFITTIFKNKKFLSNQTWKKLNLAWGGFFLLCGILNIYIIYFLSETLWIYFKILGLPILTLLFIIINLIYIYIIYKKN
ncbi:MAG: septation protein IspZ [Buchnera aphidicola (Eriosoma harunire)]